MKMLSDFQAGATVKYHGEPCIVLEHRKDGTLLMVLEQIEHTFGSDNDFAKSDLREHLNGAYMDTLTQGNHGEILKRAIDLTAVNGSKQYGIDTCCIAPLTFDEYRKYHDIIPKPEKWEWSVTPWSTPCVNEDDTWVTGGTTAPTACTPMAMSTATTATLPTGPVPLSSSPLIMLWSRKTPLHPTPQESWLRNFSTDNRADK